MKNKTIPQWNKTIPQWNKTIPQLEQNNTTVEQFQNLNRTIVERDTIETPNTLIHDP
jgi:hypothetical protein